MHIFHFLLPRYFMEQAPFQQPSSDKTTSSIQAVSPSSQPQNPDCQDATSAPSVIKDGQSSIQDQSYQHLPAYEQSMQSLQEHQQYIKESQQYNNSLILDPERKSKLELQVRDLQQQIRNLQENQYATDVNDDEAQFLRKIKEQTKQLVQLKKRHEDLKNNFQGIKQSHQQLERRDMLNFTLILVASAICTVLLVATGLGTD